jgi:hypothetical protein
MVEAFKHSYRQIHKEKRDKSCGQCHQGESNTDPSITEEKHMFVFKPIRDIGYEQLKKESHKKSQIG